MKSQISAALVTTLISMSSYAHWYVDGVGCRKDRVSDPSKVEAVHITGTKLRRYTVAKNSDGTAPTPIADPSDFAGEYSAIQKINPRTVWVGVFDFITIYDGLDLEGGRLSPIDGITKESRAEIRFKEYTDLAYGPDYATVKILTRDPGASSWTELIDFSDCWVMVSH